MPEPIEVLRRCHKCITKPCGTSFCPYGSKQKYASDMLEMMSMAFLYLLLYEDGKQSTD